MIPLQLPVLEVALTPQPMTICYKAYGTWVNFEGIHSRKENFHVIRDTRGDT